MIMTFEQWKLIFLVLILTLLSGFFDSQGFVYAAKIWQEDKVVWPMLGRAIFNLWLGIVVYFVLLRYMGRLGIHSAEIQTLAWFSVTMIGVALTSGEFFTWAWPDRLVAVSILMGLMWLISRTHS